MKHLPLNTRFLRPLLLLHRNPLRSWTHFRQSPLVDRVPDYLPWPVYLPRFELLLRVHWTSLEAIRCARIVYCYVPSRKSLRRYPFSNHKGQMCMHGVREKTVVSFIQMIGSREVKFDSIPSLINRRDTILFVWPLTNAIVLRFSF